MSQYAFKLNLSQIVAASINTCVGPALYCHTGINDLTEQDMLYIMEACDNAGEFGIAHDFDIILSNGDENTVHDIINC